MEVQPHHVTPDLASSALLQHVDRLCCKQHTQLKAGQLFPQVASPTQAGISPSPAGTDCQAAAATVGSVPYSRLEQAHTKSKLLA